MTYANPEGGFRAVSRTSSSATLLSHNANTKYVTISGGDSPVQLTLPASPAAGTRFGFAVDSEDCRINDNGSTIRMPWGDETGDIISSLAESSIELLYDGAEWAVVAASGVWGDVGATNSHAFDGNVSGATENNVASFDADGNIKDSGELATDLLHANGLVLGTTVVSAATYTVDSGTDDDTVLLVTRTASGACTITLPSSAAVDGRTLFIKDAGLNAGTYNITIDTQSTEKIDGNDEAVLNVDGAALTLISDGTDWFVI